MVEPAVRKALRETVFRFELVLRINVTAQETIDREVLIYTAFAGMLALLAGDDRKERRADPVYLERLAQYRDGLISRADELLAAGDARSIAETRYLEGHAALFPDAVAAWAERLRLAQELAVMADAIAELEGVVAGTPMGPGGVSARAVVLLADLVEPARSTALDKLDEGRHALAIATAWLRSKRPSLRQADEQADESEPARGGGC